ncbi:MAG: 2-dehydro-3-deoxygalactonokinase [Methylobacteriaceae bacterium]|nr:2-dehydro-3-deoxygalactonokinase [Methylobacteriaceae bacterium]
MTAPAFIAVDWGTTSMRAALVSREGDALARAPAGEGILKAAERGFEATLFDAVAALAAPAEAPILLAGMIGSRNGWVEVPYAVCPAGPEALVAGAARREVRGRTLVFIPGLSCEHDGRPDVMRGEETQIFGACVGPGAEIVLPGTHSKWASLSGGRIAGFRTYMTGELYAALRGHTILGALARGEAADEAAFARGVETGAGEAALTHALFSARTLALFGRLAAEAVPSYLSGLLIGAELADARRRIAPGARVLVVGEARLTARYVAAGRLLGLDLAPGPEDAAFRGLARLHAAMGEIA